MSFKLIMDSIADMPHDMQEQYDIEMIPYGILLGGKEYADKETISNEQVYEALREGTMPKTSQISPDRVLDTFTKYLEEGKDIMYISFSSKMSGSYQTTTMLCEDLREKYPDRAIEVIDGKAGATALGLILIKAAQLREAGLKVNEVGDKIRESISHVEHIFSLDNLEWLAKGGRLSKGKALVGDLLNIKPLLEIEDGKILQYGKARGNKKAYKALVKEVKNRVGSYTDQVIGISHVDDLERAKKMQSLIEVEIGIKNFMICPIGSTLSVYLGLGGIGVCFFNEKESPRI